MREHLKAIGAWAKECALQIFPWPLAGTASTYADERLADPAAMKNIAAAEQAIAGANDVIACYIADRARAMFEQEDQRQASVMGRAQSLFFAVALLSSLLSVGAGFLVSARAPHLGEILIISLLAIFLVIQINLLVLNLARAIGGLEYTRAGASDFARWAGATTLGKLQQNEAILTLAWYRRSAHINSWRFDCLERALRALRNVVIGSGLLVIVVLAFANLPAPVTCTDKTEFRGETVSYTVECPIAAPQYRLNQH